MDLDLSQLLQVAEDCRQVLQAILTHVQTPQLAQLAQGRRQHLDAVSAQVDELELGKLLDLRNNHLETVVAHLELGQGCQLDHFLGQGANDVACQIQSSAQNSVMQTSQVARERGGVLPAGGEDFIARDDHKVRFVERQSLETRTEPEAIRQPLQVVSTDVEMLKSLEVSDPLHVSRSLVNVVHQSNPLVHVDLVVAVVAHLLHHDVHDRLVDVNPKVMEAPEQLVDSQRSSSILVDRREDLFRPLSQLSVIQPLPELLQQRRFRSPLLLCDFF
mmetsp:Transcript_21431/g.48532  ORF Transcript_21431/g.48532 Transcript_21431/m.48532 type:complete len:274 (+) Transcript_21431:1687-2508(+)